MTILTTQPFNNWSGNGSSITFNFDFLVNKTSELVVFLDGDEAHPLVYGVDYSIHEFGNANGSYITFPLSGSTHSVLTDSEIISLVSSLPIKQESGFTAVPVLERTLDYIVRCLQIVNRKVERSIKTKEGSSQSADDLINALTNSAASAVSAADAATQSALTASAAQTSAANSATAAANSAATVNFPTPVALNYHRMKSDLTGYENRTPAQVASDIGVTRKNLLTNASFFVNQRAYVSGVATTTANQVTLDRWRVVTSGQNLTFTDSNGTRTITAPSGGVEQIIFGSWLQSGTYTLSWNGTATATVNGTAITNGGNIALAGGSNVTVKFSSGTVANAQFENGTIATIFEVPDFINELVVCGFDYRKSYDYATAPASITTDGNLCKLTINAYTFYDVGYFAFGGMMRVTPTVTVYDPNNGASGYIFNSNRSIHCSATVGAIGLIGCILTGSGANASEGIYFHFTASTGY